VLRSLGKNYSPQFNGVVPTGNPLNWKADITKIGAIGFVPNIQLEDGIKSFVTWCKSELLDI